MSEEKAGGVQPAGASQPELKVISSPSKIVENWKYDRHWILAMYLMHPVKEGEDYGKGVIFYLRENKVRGGWWGGGNLYFTPTTILRSEINQGGEMKPQ